MNKIYELAEELIIELEQIIKNNLLSIVLTIALMIVLTIVWYFFLSIVGGWDKINEWFYPNNILNSIIGGVIYFLILIFPIVVTMIIADIAII